MSSTMVINKKQKVKEQFTIKVKYFDLNILDSKYYKTFLNPFGKLEYAIFLSLSAFFISCHHVETKDEIYKLSNQKSKSFIVDTITVKEIELNNICFLIAESTYPQIAGIDDGIFQKQINDIFIKNFNTFIEKAKIQLGGCSDIDEDEENSVFNIPASANGYFEILTDNDSIVSIAQYFVTLPGGGGNGWELASAVTNIEVNKRVVLNNSDLNMNFKKNNLVNMIIKQFFDKEYPQDAIDDQISYPYITSKKQFDNLNFGLRNDSIMLVTEAFPTAHYSYTTYIIPIEKWKGK